MQGAEIGKAIGARLGEVQARSGLSQRDFAARLGVSPSYFSEVRAGKGKPSLEMMVGVAIRFPEVSLRWLLTGEGARETAARAVAGPGPPGVADSRAGYGLEPGASDPRLEETLERVRAWWCRADADQRVWFGVELLRQFPELLKGEQ